MDAPPAVPSQRRTCGEGSRPRRGDHLHARRLVGGAIPKAYLAIFAARGGEQPAATACLGTERRVGQERASRDRLVVASEHVDLMREAQRDPQCQSVVVASEHVDLMREALRDHQCQSVVVASAHVSLRERPADPRGNQRQSEAIRACESVPPIPEAIRGNQGHSRPIKATQRPLKGHSANLLEHLMRHAIRGNQRHSKATQRTCLSVRRSHSLSSQPTELKPLEPVSTYGPEQSQQSGK